MSSRASQGSGCKDVVMIAGSIATILALVVTTLALVRALLDVTWPLPAINTPDPEGESAHGSNRTPPSASMLMPTETYTPAPPTATLAPTDTPAPPTATSAPTDPPLPLTGTPVLTSTAVLSTTTPTTTHVLSSTTPSYAYLAPILLDPTPEAQLTGKVCFEWQWDGPPLPEGLAFDLLIWSEEEHLEHEGAGALGVIELGQGSQADVELEYVDTIMAHGGGTYYWTVIVVQEEPYERVGAWGEKRIFTYILPEPPEESPTESP